jgi:hypothetical protein
MLVKCKKWRFNLTYICHDFEGAVPKEKHQKEIAVKCQTVSIQTQRS